MTNGFGAAFGGLLLAALLAGLAALLTLSGLVVAGWRRRGGAVSRCGLYPAVGLTAGVLLVAGFAVVALADEATALAGLFVALVFVPLTVCGLDLHRRASLSPLETVATTGVAWGPPFLVGLLVAVGGFNLLTGVFDLTAGEAQRRGFQWVATAVGGLVVLLGTRYLGRLVRARLWTPTSSA